MCFLGIPVYCETTRFPPGINLPRRSSTTPWRMRLDARFPPLGYRDRFSFTPCGCRGGRKGVCVGFSRCYFSISLPQTLFHHFSTLISFVSFHFISPSDDGSGVVGRHSCKSQNFNIGSSSHLILDPAMCRTRVEEIKQTILGRLRRF